MPQAQAAPVEEKKAVPAVIKMIKGQDVDVFAQGGDLIELGLAWDFFPGMAKVDLDASAVLFDSCGGVIDAAYFKQLSICDGAVVHSGDNRSGEGEGDDEAIKIALDRLPFAATVIMFVINSHSGNFQSLEAARVELRNLKPDGQKHVIANMHIAGGSTTTGLIMCSLRRAANNTWKAQEISAPVSGGDWHESKEEIRAVCDQLYIEDVMKGERNLSMEKTFVMKKDDSCALPSGQNAVIVGLGWDCQKKIDLDASVIGVDSNKQKTFLVYYGDKEKPGVTHSGDNTTGDGAGDDETIRIDFDKVPANTHELFITVNIYSSGATFMDVRNAYVRVCNPGNQKFTAGHEMARYPLDGQLKSRGLIFCRFVRQNGAWSLEALAWGCEGPTAASSETIDVCTGK